MKRLMLTCIVLVLLAVVALFAMDALVKQAVEAKGTALTGGKVTIGSVGISPFLGKATFKNITIANPRGFKSENAFQIKTVEIKAGIGTLFADPLVVQEVDINAPEVTYEVSFSGGNMAALLKNILVQGDAGSEKKIVIKHLSVTGGQMSYGVPEHQEKIAIPELQVNNIGTTEGGLPASKAVAEVLQHFTDHLATIEGSTLERQVKGIEFRLKKMFE